MIFGKTKKIKFLTYIWLIKKDTFAIVDFVVKTIKTGIKEITLIETILGYNSFNEHSFIMPFYSITINGVLSSSSSNLVFSSSSSSKQLSLFNVVTVNKTLYTV